MITLFIIIFVLGVPVVLAAYQRGHNKAIAIHVPKALENAHSHIWGPWEGFELDVVSENNGRLLYTVSAQRRHCDECNYEERKKLRSQ